MFQLSVLDSRLIRNIPVEVMITTIIESAWRLLRKARNKKSGELNI